ncbi:transposase family protein [Oribacterium sp. FC2011]|uniref:transposase family protein n=1 Tax=Oribacterium sp. FC2011 TaxID=1408311 RepID=UPI0004E185DF|nr:transposase family protein [Oribacterium sp. FC2011]
MISIADLLDLEDPNISITSTRVEGQIKILTLETKPSATFCPQCGYRMHSRGTKVRNISHPIFQDGYSLSLELKQRRWRCTNKDCRYDLAESFKFVDKNRRKTNASDMMIVQAFRDLDETAASIARRFNSSDTHVLDIFDRYVKLDRLPLTDIISVDEVHTEIDTLPKSRKFRISVSSNMLYLAIYHHYQK